MQTIHVVPTSLVGMNPGDPAGVRLSDDELVQLVGLLRRFCDTDLDQWALWKLGTASNETFVMISRAPFPETPDEMYTDIGRWADAQTPPHAGTSS